MQHLTVRSLKNRIRNLEKKIGDLEKYQREFDLALSNPEEFKELSQQADFFEEYERNKKKRKELEIEWEKAVDQLDSQS